MDDGEPPSTLGVRRTTPRCQLAKRQQAAQLHRCSHLELRSEAGAGVGDYAADAARCADCADERPRLWTPYQLRPEDHAQG